jgi:hypothetical protein
MSEAVQRTSVLITVMTYPHPSRLHEELVCTAGITKDFEWVRLYPIDYRYRPRCQQFRKYQWVELDLWPFGQGNDQRKESRRPELATLSIAGRPLSPDHDWRERRQIIDKMPVRTVKQLQGDYERDRTSLGIVKPTRVIDLAFEPVEQEWKPEWQALYSQLRLFGPPPKPLTKIPYKFTYIFECEDSTKPHRAMIEDWELGVLFLKEVHRLGNNEAAAQSVKKKFFDTICGPRRDTNFFMGTVFPYNTWVVLGTFWPPRRRQLELL